MKTRYIKKISVKDAYIPYKWMENLVSNGKIGGVMLVYVEGFTETEIAIKVKAIKEFCKTLKGGEMMSDTFRKEYTSLDEEQKAAMLAIKTKAEELEALFDAITPEGERSDRSRLKAVAKTELEGAVMWAVKAVTTAKV